MRAAIDELVRDGYDAVELTGRLHRLREPRLWAALAGAVFTAEKPVAGAVRLAAAARKRTS